MKFSIGNICKEVQRIQFDLEQPEDITSAIDRCKNLDQLLCDIEDGTHELENVEIIQKKFQMSDNKRFKRVHEMRNGQIGITDELHNSGDKDFPKNLTEAEAVDLLNGFFDEIQQLKRQLFAAESALIYEYSTNIDEDLKELKKTIYGEH